MGVIERDTIMRHKDASGNDVIEYPATKAENVIGLDTALGAKANASHTHLSDAVFKETSSSSTTRTVTIDGVTSWDDVKNIPLNIQATTYGTTSVSTLNINSLGAKSIYFPSGTGNSVTTTPSGYYWVRTNGIYTVVWDGTYLKILNPQVRDASTSYKGVVQLSSSVSDTSTSKAATPSAVKAAYDLANTAKEAADAAQNALIDTETGIEYKITVSNGEVFLKEIT